MPYLFDICHHRFNVLAQLFKNARVIRVSLDVCMLQLVVSRKYLAHLYSKLFLHLELPFNVSACFPRAKPLCGQVIKLDCGQFRPAVANALLHVKHLCPVDIGELLHAAFDFAYVFFRP